MDLLATLIAMMLWTALFTLMGSTLCTVRRIERKVEAIAKAQEQREMYERMRNQQYQQSQQYQQYGNMNGYDQNNRL